MDGFLNLNKPLGLTSHDCVARVRRLLKLKRVGHAGTLDPAAEGVLPIAVGRSTRLLQYLPDGKSYRAIVCFGLTTTTDDLEGEILTRRSTVDLDLPTIQAALPQFLGKIQQIPPAYSAIQVQGQRLYQLARSGVAVEVPMREVEILRLEVVGWRSGETPELDLAVDCGGGTYIRAIARDLGEAVGTGATLAGLVRTASSGFDLTQSLSLEQLEQQVQAGTLELVSPEVALQHLPIVRLEDALARRWCLGQRLAMSSSPERMAESAVRVHHAEQGDRFLGVGRWVWPEADGIVLKPEMVYAPISGAIAPEADR